MWIAVRKDTGEIIAQHRYALFCSLIAQKVCNQGDYIITKEDVWEY